MTRSGDRVQPGETTLCRNRADRALDVLVGGKFVLKLADVHRRIIHSVMKESGLLNSNSFVRIGWGWVGSRATGHNVFRISIGNRDALIHFHRDLFQ